MYLYTCVFVYVFCVCIHVLCVSIHVLCVDILLFVALLGYVKKSCIQDLHVPADDWDHQVFSGVPQKRPVSQTKDRKRAVVSRSALQVTVDMGVVGTAALEYT